MSGESPEEPWTLRDSRLGLEETSGEADTVEAKAGDSSSVSALRKMRSHWAPGPALTPVGYLSTDHLLFLSLTRVKAGLLP